MPEADEAGDGREPARRRRWLVPAVVASAFLLTAGWIVAAIPSKRAMPASAWAIPAVPTMKSWQAGAAPVPCFTSIPDLRLSPGGDGVGRLNVSWSVEKAETCLWVCEDQTLLDDVRGLFQQSIVHALVGRYVSTADTSDVAGVTWRRYEWHEGM